MAATKKAAKQAADKVAARVRYARLSVQATQACNQVPWCVINGDARLAARLATYWRDLAERTYRDARLGVLPKRITKAEPQRRYDALLATLAQLRQPVVPRDGGVA